MGLGVLYYIIEYIYYFMNCYRFLISTKYQKQTICLFALDEFVKCNLRKKIILLFIL